MKNSIGVRDQSSSSSSPRSLHCRINSLHFLSVFILVLGILSELGNSAEVEENGSSEITPVEFQWCAESSKSKPNSGINHGGRTKWIVPSTITATGVNFTVILTSRAVIKCGRGIPQVNFTVNFVKNPGSSSSSSGSIVPEFLTNGYFHPNEIHYFHPKEFCISELTTVNVTVQLCKEPECGLKHPCISKCCPLGQVFTVKRRFTGNTSSSALSCSSLETLGRSAGSKFHPVLYKSSVGVTMARQGETAIHYLRKRKNTFNCSTDAPLLMSPFATKNTKIKELYKLNGLCFQVQEDGALRYKNHEFEWTDVDRNDYCLDGFHYPEFQKTFLGREEDYGVLLCAMASQNKEKTSRALMYGSALLVSSIFLLLTFLVYLLLWGQQTICGWVTMSHAASMFFAYLFLGTAFLILHTMDVQANQTIWCKILGVLAHFFFLSTFCWLSVISFDLFWTFRCFTPRSQRSKGFGRYLIYCCFGWGLPLIVVGVSVTVDWVYGSDPCSMAPSYGVRSCYVDKDALGRYVYYPVAVLLFLNLTFFGITTYKLHEYKKSTRMATQNMQERQQLFKLFIKLYFIMGVTWIFEFLSWYSVGLNLTWYWVILDFINVFQAVAIFIIFVCKQDIVRSLIREYPCLACVLNPIARCFRCTPVGRDTENTTVTGVLTTPTLKLKLRDSA